METPKLGVASILWLNIYYIKNAFLLNKCSTIKWMSHRVLEFLWISEVPSNPQLTLANCSGSIEIFKGIQPNKYIYLPMKTYTIYKLISRW